MAQYDVDLRDYWRILKKRKVIVILMVCLVGLSSYGFAKLKEPLPLFETGASVKIERTNNMAGLAVHQSFPGRWFYPFCFATGMQQAMNRPVIWPLRPLSLWLWAV